MLFFFIAVLGLYSCRQTSEELPPTIRFVSGQGYISHDTTLKAGTPFRFCIKAEKGDNDLTNFQIRVEYSGGTKVIMDTGIHNDVFVYSALMSKGIHAQEKWIFRILDDRGKWKETSFNLYSDSTANCDTLLFYPSVILGAQQCTTYGSFLDLKNMLVYFQNDAFLVQDSIEMLYYYGFNGEANTISSPNANIDESIFPGPTGLTNWTVKNETRYFKTNLSPSVFDATFCSMIVIDAFDALHSKRKAKNLTQGDVYSFRTKKGKFGLFKVINVNGGAEGTIEIAIKITK